MSSWMRPTTADVGLRSFAASKARLFEETTAGMQDYLLASEIPSKAIHHTSVWTVQIPVHDDSNGLLLVKWLEEVLFMDEVEQKWLVDCSIKIEELKGELSLQAHVRWVNSGEIEKEVEIKAVTRQDLMVAEVGANQTLESPWPEVPTFEGPGWYSDVVFDI
ncbi:MAG: archease [Candidatus Poseidoniaceae archaeon]